mgnify:FL=1|tara:strand:+ start:39 stop:833 length:795 start_codon:yes stop_codon:yes gene_type:complete
MSEIRVENIIGETGNDAVKFTKGINVTGVTTATTFSGSGASLTSLPAANLTGTLPAISGANLTGIDAGGFKKIYEASTTGGTAVNSFSVDGYFNDSLYQHYKVIISDHFTLASSGHNTPGLRFNVGGSAVTSSNYYWSLHASYGAGGASNIQVRGSGTSNTGESSISQMQGTWECDHYNYQLQNYEITFFNPTTAKVTDGNGDGAKYVTWSGSMLGEGQGSASYPVSTNGMGMLKTNSPLTGFTMFSGNSTTFTYKISLYGFKK